MREAVVSAGPVELAALEHVLATIPREARDDFEIDFLTDRFRRPMVLYGAGETALTVTRGLARKGVCVVALADTRAERWGSRLGGVDVLSPEEAVRRHGAEGVIVLTFRASDAEWEATISGLEAMGARRVVSVMHLLEKWPELNGWPVLSGTDWCDRGAEVRRVFGGLADRRSRTELLGHLRWRAHHDRRALPTGDVGDQYFAPDLVRLRPDESLVDGGAFDGDSLRSFLARAGGDFSRIDAFEPDPTTFARLEGYAGSLSGRERIRLHRAAISDRSGTLEFSGDGSHSARAETGSESSAPCVALDEACADTTPTFLKLDLEGAEQAALDGARGLLGRTRPIVTIAVYHRPADLLEIPLRLMSTLDRYRFHLRTHNRFGFDVVLYAIPEERAIS